MIYLSLYLNDEKIHRSIYECSTNLTIPIRLQEMKRCVCVQGRVLVGDRSSIICSCVGRAA